MNDAADHPPIVFPFGSGQVPWQVRRNACPSSSQNILRASKASRAKWLSTTESERAN
jgi:hypothetical protein